MLLVLFLVSVAVMELILKPDRKQRGQRRPDIPEATPSPAEIGGTTTSDLLALADAVPPARPVPDAVCHAPEYNRDDARAE